MFPKAPLAAVPPERDVDPSRCSVQILGALNGRTLTISNTLVGLGATGIT